jgi:hypothetical protein
MEIGGLLKMKPNFEEMSVPQLRAYVLEHREDDEAIRVLFHHPSLEHKWKTMPPLYENGKPNEENIRLAEEVFRKAIEEKDREREQKKDSQD